MRIDKSKSKRIEKEFEYETSFVNSNCYKLA
jgi:hypothetical protein